MIDIGKLIDQFEPGSAPGDALETGQELGNFPNRDFPQDTENIDFSHFSQFPTAKQERYKGYSCALENSGNQKTDECIARDAHACGVGNVGTAGNASENNDISFPLVDRELGNWEKRQDRPAGASDQTASAPSPLSHHAAPQRSDWWTGAAMAEVDAMAPPAGNPIPITPDHVRAAVERELRHLAALGITGSEAGSRAIAIVRVKIGNSPATAERQTNANRCQVCRELLRDDAPVIAVLSGKPDHAIHLHRACHDAYAARRRALVDSIMRSAGYATEAEGEPA